MALRALLGMFAVWTNCSTPNDVASVTSIDFAPSTVTSGTATFLNVTYDLKEPITDGTVVYAYTINGLPFSPTKESLCSQTSCPKTEGLQSEISIGTFPDIVADKITTKITWTDSNNNQIWCVQGVFTKEAVKRNGLVRPFVGHEWVSTGHTWTSVLASKCVQDHDEL